LGKSLRRLLRQIVPNAAGDDPVLVLDGEKLAIGRVIRIVRRAIGIAFKADRRNGDGRTFEYAFGIFPTPKSESMPIDSLIYSPL
jgi:hypothetical protein